MLVRRPKNIGQQKKKRKRTDTACGGCDYVINMLRMMNSFRLEFMDEAGIIVPNTGSRFDVNSNKCRFSPLYVAYDTLVQVLHWMRLNKYIPMSNEIA